MHLGVVPSVKKIISEIPANTFKAVSNQLQGPMSCHHQSVEKMTLLCYPFD